MLLKQAYMLVVFEGLSAAGKTTQINNVHKALQEAGINSLIYQKENRILADLEKTARQYQFLSAERDFLFWIIRKTEERILRDYIEKHRKSEVVLVDRLWGSLIAYSSRLIQSLPWDFWRDLGKIFIKPDITFLFKVDLETAKGRKSSPTLQDVQLVNHLNSAYQKLAKEFNWEIINANQNELLMTKEIINTINKKLNLTL